MTRFLLTIGIVAVGVLTTSAQQPPAGQPTVAPVHRQPVERAGSTPAPIFSYDPAGRRDPFVSLVDRGPAQVTTDARAEGLPGMLIQEVNLKGIMKERSGFIALVQGPDRKTYPIRTGQRLLDGTVKSITHDAIVFAQDVNDPLSLVKQKEVRKTLRSVAETRG